MAPPLSAAKFIAALKAEGLKVVEVGDWRDHTRTSSSRPWGEVHGVMIHHTVTKGTADSVRICRDGYSSLPGPLCHGVIDKQGVVHLVGYGRTNHAGGGDPKVLAAVKAETYGDAPPAPTKGNADGVDGNRAFYGFECINLGDGKDPWPEAQLEAIEKVSAAICRAHGWTQRSVIGHKEWSEDKVDPRGFSMSTMRDRIGDRLDSKPTPPPTKKPPAKTIPPFPGRDAFRLGHSHPAVTELDKQLIRLGFTEHHDGDGYQPGPRFTEHTRLNVADFQRSRRELRGDPDGYPGPLTWQLLHS